MKAKSKSYKNVNLSTSFTKHNAFKLSLKFKENIEFDSSKATNETPK